MAAASEQAAIKVPRDKHGRILPGATPNPGGRPKMSPELTAKLSKLTPEAVDRLAFWMRGDDPRASVTAALAILDRHLGKPQQSVDLGFTEDVLDIVAERVAQRTNGHSGTGPG